MVLDWIIDMINLVFKSKIRKLVERQSELAIVDKIPTIIQPIYDNVTSLQGIAGDYLMYQFKTAVVGDPIIKQTGVSVKIQLKGVFRG